MHGIYSAYPLRKGKIFGKEWPFKKNKGKEGQRLDTFSMKQVCSRATLSFLGSFWILPQLKPAHFLIKGTPIGPVIFQLAENDSEEAFQDGSDIALRLEYSTFCCFDASPPSTCSKMFCLVNLGSAVSL